MNCIEYQDLFDVMTVLKWFVQIFHMCFYDSFVVKWMNIG